MRKRAVSLLLKSGSWIFVLSVIILFFPANGVSGPTTEAGTYAAETVLVSAPVGILMCIAAGVRAIVRNKPE
jgi:hypothetical protein